MTLLSLGKVSRPQPGTVASLLYSRSESSSQKIRGEERIHLTTCIGVGMDLYLGWGEGMGTGYCSLPKSRYCKVICAGIRTGGDLSGAEGGSCSLCMQSKYKDGEC